MRINTIKRAESHHVVKVTPKREVGAAGEEGQRRKEGLVETPQQLLMFRVQKKSEFQNVLTFVPSAVEGGVKGKKRENLLTAQT